MSKIYSPKIVTDSLVMCLDASNNKSYPTTDLPVKAGLALWLDAADDTAFSYSSGTTITQWRDKSGLNNHAIVGGGSPVRSVAINSRKAVSFTSTSWFRCLTGSFNSTATHFLVCRATTSSATYQRVYNGGADAYIFMGGLSNNIATFWGTGSSWIDVAANSPSTTILNTLRIISVINNGSTGTPYYDGTTMSTKTTTNSGAYIGYELNSYSGGNTAQALIGEVCEIIVFNKQLSAIELKQVHTYLGQKWGISNTDRSIIDLAGNDDNGLFGNGTVANMPVYSYYNKGTFKFDGSADYINCGNANTLNFGSGDFSVEMWFTRDTNATTNLRLLSKGAESDLSSSAGFAFFGADSGINFAVNPSGTRAIISAASYSVGEWVHVVGLVERGSTMRAYKNAVLVNSATAPAGSVSNASVDLNIGRSTESSSLYWAGNIAIVRIYNKALSAAEISQNYEAQKSKFANTIVQQGLVLNLDAGNIYSYAGAGTTWIDVSGAVNDFAAVGSPTYSANEFILNGTTQYFYISAASGFFSAANSFYADVGYAWTISVWFKFPVSPTSLRDATVNAANCSYCMFGNSGGIGGGETMALFISGVSGTYAGVHPYYCMVGLRGGKTQLSLSSVNTNTWNNVVITWDGTAGRGYFNGVDRGALTTAGQGLQVSGYTVGATASGFSSHLFEGSISQTFVYNRAISAAEVLQNYNATKGRFGL